MCCTRLVVGNTVPYAKMTQKSPSVHHRTTLSSYIFATKACIDNRKKNLLNSKTSSTCSYKMANFGPLTAEIVSLVWGTPANFDGFRVIGFVTAATSLTGGQPYFARCLAVSRAATLYIHFWGQGFGGSCPLTEFCQVQNSLCVQVLPSPILTALQRGTPAADISQTLRRGTRNGITELSQAAPPIFGWAAITLGIGPHSSLVYSVVFL